VSPFIPYIFYLVGSVCFVCGTLVAIAQLAAPL
jgi:hypothetical protein